MAFAAVKVQWGDRWRVAEDTAEDSSTVSCRWGSNTVELQVEQQR